jgi:hypothetical protein
MKRLFTLAVFMAALVTTCFAQLTKPAIGAKYQIMNSNGCALTSTDSKCIITTPDKLNKTQAWVFESTADEGYYYLKNVGTDKYFVFTPSNSWDNWSMSVSSSLPADLSHAEFGIDALTSDYVGLKVKAIGLYIGTDDGSDGNGMNGTVWGNSGVQHHAYWQIVALPTGQTALDELIAQVQKYEADNLTNYTGLAGELEDAIVDFGTPANTDSVTIKACQDTITAVWSQVKQGLADAQELQVLLTTSAKLLNNTTYPGLDAFQKAYNTANDVAQSQKTISKEYAAAVVDLKAAIKTYKLSQAATPDAPADYTFLIQHPWFCNDANTPESASADDITAANLSSSVVNGDGWVNGSTAKGGDQHPSYGKHRTCYNAWNSNYSGYLDIHQDLTDLPDGLYSVSCDAITPNGCRNDQHAYAASATQTINSLPLTNSDWTDDDAASVWENLSTAVNGTVYVSDGKLSIGFRGSRNPSNGDGSNGWFLVTNFQLSYYGMPDATALKAMLDARTANCQAQADSMLFKGDKATYQAVINTAKNATDVASINAALVAMNGAQQQAAVSIAAQDKVLRSAYTSIKDSIAAGVYTDATLHDIMQSAVDNATALINAENQTYACRDSIISSMKAYLNTYAPAYVKALKAIASCVQESSKSVINNVLAAQLETVKSGMCSASLIAEYAAQIEQILKDAATNELMAKGGTNYTALITNPECESTDRTVNPTGWDISLINSSNGWSNDKGQQYDGNASACYLNAWNGSAKALLFNAHQTITNLPNGTYTLKAMCRTSGQPGSEGTYLYTIADHDSVNGIQLAMVKREQCNITKATQGLFTAFDGTDSLLYVDNSFGSIWEAAASTTSFGLNGSDLDLAVYQANGNTGFGWHYVEVPAIVTKHELTIGFTNDSTFTLGHNDIEGKPCVPFSGWWVSADNFSLTMTVPGDNNNWSPITAVTTARINNALQVSVINRRIVANAPCKVYNMSGQQMNVRNVLPLGCYIVKGANTAVKVIVK